MDADRLVESLLNPSNNAPENPNKESGTKAYAKPDNSRIAESVDFSSIDNQIDELVQGAIKQLKDTSARVGDRSAIYTPVTMQPMIDETNNVRSRRIATNLQISEEQDRNSAAVSAEQEALRNKGIAEGDIAKANNLKAEREAAIYNQIANSSGIRPEDVAVVSSRIASMRPGVENKLREVQKLQSVGPLDNPLDWIINQIQLPSKIQDYNSEASIMNNLEASVNDSIAMANATATFATKGIPTTTAEQAAAQSKLAKALADKAISDSEETLARTNIDFATKKLASDIHAASVTKDMTQLQIEQAKAELAAQIHNINVADNNATRLLKAAELLEKMEKTKGLDVLLRNYDRVLGHPEGTTTRYNFERFGEVQRQNIVAIGAGSLGPTNDPLTSLEIFQLSRPGPQLSKETRGFVNYLQGVREKALTDNRLQAIHGKEEQRAYVAGQMKSTVADDIRSASRTDSVFHELNPAIMLAAPGAIDPNSKTAKILEPYTKQQGNVPTDMVVAAFMQEFPNPGEAGAAISAYYKKNIQMRNSYMNAELFGVILPKTYHMRRSTSILAAGAVTENYGNSVSYDLTDPAEATKFVLRKQADELLLKSMATNGIGAP